MFKKKLLGVHNKYKHCDHLETFVAFLLCHTISLNFTKVNQSAMDWN